MARAADFERSGRSVVAALAALGPGAGRADARLVLPSGLPTQVVPAFPEPGLPAFTFPQQNLTDTGGVTGATAATGTGSSDLTFGGTGSGVAGAILATGYSDLLGQSVGTGECVALVQATSNVGLTGSWGSRGAGRREHGSRAGDGNRDVRVGWDLYEHLWAEPQTGIYVEDQWLGHAASTRIIPWTTSNSYESGSQFHVITHS